MYCTSCFFFKQKTAYEMRISDGSSDVCSSDLVGLTFPPMAMLADTLSAMITLLGKEKGRTATPSGLSEVMRQAARPRPRGRVPQPPVLRPHRREARWALQVHRDPARRVSPAPTSPFRAPPHFRSPPPPAG